MTEKIPPALTIREILELPSDEFDVDQVEGMLTELIQQARDDSWSEGNTAGVLQGDRRVVKAIQQAKEGVAREIFEEIENTGLIAIISEEDFREWQSLKSKYPKG